MNHVIKSIFILLAITSFALFAGEIKEVSYNINGMTCQGCVGKVSAILDKTAGIRNQNVNIDNSNCNISYDAALTNPETIKAELSKTQFTISDVVDKKQNPSVISWLKKLFN